MNSKLKCFLQIIAIALALFIIYACVGFYTVSKRNTQFRNYCPVLRVNTLWTCQEKDIYFITSEKGVKASGIIEAEGEMKPFDIYFSLRPRGFSIASLQVDTGELTSEHDGGASYADGVCTLTYNAEKDRNHFFGEETGEVTLTFVMEYIP